MNEEKNQPVSNQSPTVITGVTDRAADFAQQQEQKRRDFEDQQERKRQAFETKLETQKAIREWLMLIITVAAVAAAAWTAYEARQARIEAAEAATKSFDAQAATMRLDERPYVKLSFQDAQFVTFRELNLPPGVGQMLMSKSLLTVYGRTAALDVFVEAKCEAGSHGVKPPTQRGATLPYVFPMVAPAESNEVRCGVELNKENLQTFKEEDNVFMYYGTVFYKDIFKQDHMTQFCWTIEYKPTKHPSTRAEQCPFLHLEIT
jgi:hypothetical protein